MYQKIYRLSTITMTAAILTATLVATSWVATSCGKKDPKNSGISEQKGIVALVHARFGEVTVNGKPIQVGASLRQGDVVQTGEKGSVDIMLIKKKSIIRIKAKAKLTIEKVTDAETRLKLDSGWLAAYIKNRNVSIIMPTTVASVRGTSICMKVENPNQTYTCTCNGTVHYSADSVPGFNDTASHHSSHRFARVDGKIRKQSAAMKYHGDAVINELAAMVNGKVDWTKPD